MLILLFSLRFLVCVCVPVGWFTLAERCSVRYGLAWRLPETACLRMVCVCADKLNRRGKKKTREYVAKRAKNMIYYSGSMEIAYMQEAFKNCVLVYGKCCQFVWLLLSDLFFFSFIIIICRTSVCHVESKTSFVISTVLNSGSCHRNRKKEVFENPMEQRKAEEHAAHITNKVKNFAGIEV